MTDPKLKSAPLAYQNEPFLNSPDGRLLRLMAEYSEPLSRFRREQIQDTVVFFGSARIHSHDSAEHRLVEVRANGAHVPDGDRPESWPASPRLAGFWSSGGRRPSWLGAVATAVVGGGVAAAITNPAGGLAVGAAVLLALLVNWARVFLTAAAVGLAAATAVVMTVQQQQYHFPWVIQWPAQFPVANTLAWMAVAALGADALVEAVRHRPGRRRSPGGVGVPPLC